MDDTGKSERGTQRVHGAVLARWSLGLTLLLGCAGSGEIVCKPDPVTGSQQCQGASADPASAVVTTGVAGGVFAVTGCTVNGCQLPDWCNPKTKRCEPTPCSEGRACPSGYSCNLKLMICR